MANPITQIILSAIDRTKAAFNSVTGGLRSVGDEAEKSNTRLGKVGNEITGLFGKIGLSFAALYNVRQLGGLLDDFSNLQARLKLASRSTEEYNQANSDLVRIAKTAKAPIAETATLYTRIAASVKDLDVSQGSVADTTEAVALSLKISGAAAAETSSAMLQFSQSMAKGKLDSEEFNTIAEAAPRLMQALADSLKVPVGSLKELSKEGKITREVLLNSLLAALPKLRAEAETLPDTFGSAFTELKNQLFLVAGEFDKTTGVTKSFSEALGSIGKTGIEALAVVGANVLFVFKGVGREIGGIAAQLVALSTGDFKAFKFIGDAMKEDAAEARRVLDAFEKNILQGDTGLNKKRQENSAETRDVVIGDRDEESKGFKKSVNDQISDTKRLQEALRSAFTESTKAEEDYLKQAKKLRAEANGGTVGEGPEAQALAALDATIAAMKLQRTAATESLDSVQQQAEALRTLADGIEDVSKKESLRRQANLAEATALERAAADERARYQGLSQQQDMAAARSEKLKASLDGIGKEVKVDIKPGPQTQQLISDLDQIIAKIGVINTTPVSPGAGASGYASSMSEALRTEALKRGNRR